MPPLRITTWNVNGIRNPFGYHPWRDKRSFDSMFDILEADIVIMQELKIQRKDLRDDMVLVPGWDCFFSLPKHKKGYSGVAIYTRQSACAPIRTEEGVLGVLCPPGSSTPYRDLAPDRHIGGYPTDEQIAQAGIDVDPAALDAEGRCVALEFPAFVILGVYSPANSNGLRDDFRAGFFNALDKRVRNLTAAGKRVVLCGDLNVSREEIDTANAEENMRKEGVTHEEYISLGNRRIFNQLLEGGAVVEPRDEGREEPVLWDTTREFHPERKGMFTHWEQKINARPGNFGSRIDFVLCSISMKDWVSSADIQEGLMGSDHCPVYAILKEKVVVDDEEIYLVDLMNPAGMFEQGKRVRDWTLKDSPAFSGRLLPEFDRRRSIKDMFSRKPSTAKSASNGSTAEESLSATDLAAISQPTSKLPPEASQESNGQLATNGTQESQSSQPNAGSQTRRVSSPEKKRPAIAAPASKPTKRKKQYGPTATSRSPQKGQQSLKGFFKPTVSLPRDDSSVSYKAAENGEASQTESLFDSNINKNGTQDSQLKQSQSTSTTLANASTSEAADQFQPPHSNARSPSPSKDPSDSPSKQSDAESAVFIDPIVSKESWDKLFTKRAPPRCEDHDEPCVQMTTKKPGVNCGRAFWICPRPIGPSGTKEKNTQWRCRTFIWASDHNSTTPG